jgi:hypothetical protein
MFRFTIRDVLWFTVVVGLAVGWWLNHRQLVRLRERFWQLHSVASSAALVMRELGVDAEYENDNITIRGSYWPPHQAPWNEGKGPNHTTEVLKRLPGPTLIRPNTR